MTRTGSDSCYCDECLDSPEFEDGRNANSTTHLRVVGTDSESTAYSMASNWINTQRKTYCGLVLDSLSLKPIEGAAAWDVTAKHKIKQFDTNIILDYSFATTGGTAHIERSVGTMVNRSCVFGLPSKDHGGRIGFNGDGYDGVDIKCPAFTWRQSQAYSCAMMTKNFQRMIANYTGCINEYSFMGFKPREVLFEGADGQLVQDYDKITNAPYFYYKVTYSFSASPSVFGKSVGSSGTYNKAGWDYEWTEWEKITVGKETVCRPRNVFVEQVYPSVDLNDLGVVCFL